MSEENDITGSSQGGRNPAEILKTGRKKRPLGKTTPPPRKSRVISSSRYRDTKKMSASLRLSAEELAAIRSAPGVSGKRSVSEFIRQAIRERIANINHAQIPESVGVVDGIYRATIKDDVVELANRLRALEFALLNACDELASSAKVDELKRMLADEDAALERIAGRISKQ